MHYSLLSQRKESATVGKKQRHSEMCNFNMFLIVEKTQQSSRKPQSLYFFHTAHGHTAVLTFTFSFSNRTTAKPKLTAIQMQLNPTVTKSKNRISQNEDSNKLF